jgi:hypothetical protein
VFYFPYRDSRDATVAASFCAFSIGFFGLFSGSISAFMKTVNQSFPPKSRMESRALPENFTELFDYRIRGSWDAAKNASLKKGMGVKKRLSKIKNYSDMVFRKHSVKTLARQCAEKK